MRLYGVQGRAEGRDGEQALQRAVDVARVAQVVQAARVGRALQEGASSKTQGRQLTVTGDEIGLLEVVCKASNMYYTTCIKLGTLKYVQLLYRSSIHQ